MRLIHKLMPAKKQKLVISSIGVLALLVFSGFVLFEATKAEVVFADNGKEQTVSTHTNTVEDLLAELNVEVGKHDVLSHDLEAIITNGMIINYNAAKKITLSIDGEEQVFYTTADTIEQFFEEENLSFTERDEISIPKTEETKDGLHIEVSKAYQVTIDNGGEEKKIWTTGGTVKELLAEANIPYDEKGKDKISPAISEDIEKGSTISIVRVSEDEEVVTEAIPFYTETREDSSLMKGEEKVLKEGKDGSVKKVYKITKENGEEVGRELISENVTESVDRVVAVGTKEEAAIANLSSSNSSSPASGGKTLTMTASAFTSECGGCSGKTATGINLNANPNMKVIAVDPTKIPLGTRVWVEGYGEAIAGDTGGHIKGNRIDVHVPSKSAAYSWGVKTVQVKILD